MTRDDILVEMFLDLDYREYTYMKGLVVKLFLLFLDGLGYV